MTSFKKNIKATEEQDLAKYGKNFQVKLLALLIKDRSFALSILPIVKDAYFQDIYCRNVFSCINEYVKLYPNSTPSFDNIQIMLENKGEDKKLYEKVLESCETIELDDRDFVIDNTRNFCFTKHALIENEKVVEALKRGEFENAKKISIEAFRYDGKEKAKIYDLDEDYNIIFEEDEMRSPIEGTFPTFNKNSKGGPGTGDLCIVVAPSNFGKTNYLIATARHAISTGKNVAYFSYEMGGGAILSKYIAGLLDIKQEELKFNRKEIDAKMKEKGYGRLRVIEDNPSNALIPTIKAKIEYLKSTGFFTDLIIIDGLNQLKLVKGQWAVDNNDKYETLTEDLRELCREMGVPGYASWQSNRSGFAAELGDIQSVGKAIEVFQKADQLIFFTQPPELQARDECIAYLLKNRLGKKQIAILVAYDPNKGIFIEKEELNPLVFLSSREKERTGTTATKTREKLSAGLYDKSK